MNHSIFPNKCRQIAEIFDRVTAKEILVVVLDFAKKKHIGLCCNGKGDYLLKPFTVNNNKEGFAYLRERIDATCKRHAIKPQNVIIGGEDIPAYALGLLNELDQNTEHLVVRVNAWKAKANRDNIQASTDKLDLLGIGKCLINHDAYLVFPPPTDAHPCKHEEVEATRETARCRHSMVEVKTSISNKIHSLVDVLFPGFLDDNSKGVYPFTNASLALMKKEDFCAASYARKKIGPLAKRLSKLGIAEPDRKALEIIDLAKQALLPPKETIESRRECLHQLVAVYEQVADCCDSLERTSARSLAKTPGAFLTTVSGLGIVNAAGISGEQGHPSMMRSVASSCSYAGVVSSIKQTGGPDAPAKPGKVRQRCNRRLKNYIVRAANTMGTNNGPREFRHAYRTCLDNEQHADFVMARRLLGSISFMINHQTIYLPPDLRGNRQIDRVCLYEYLKDQWPKIVKKWRDVGAVDVAFADGRPLEIWRQTIQGLYQIELPLDRPKMVSLKTIPE